MDKNKKERVKKGTINVLTKLKMFIHRLIKKLLLTFFKYEVTELAFRILLSRNTRKI